MESDWREALPTAPPGYRLAGALFTTFEPAQPELLVEHLLPSLLSLSRGLDPEPAARSLYFGELALALERLRSRLTVISSPASETPERDPGEAAGAAYPWLWRYVAPFFTGARGAATQHAKLWMLHWVAADRDRGAGEEALELVISSANLTLASLKGQLQAGWRALLPLGERNSRANLASWGPLPRFLEALGESAGAEAGARTDVFTELLARCNCPGGVQLVASIPEAFHHPGEDSRWGALALGKVAPGGGGRLRVQVCTPFVGEWTSDAFRQWSWSLGAEPCSVALSWLDSEHPWARQGAGGGGWRMSRRALDSLLSEGLHLRRLGYAGDGPVCAFHESHHPDDPRWSHAKLYLLRRGPACRLLVTSANFSIAAWGTGKTRPRNFELGVLLHGEWPIQPEEEQFRDDHEVFTSGIQPPTVEAELLWGQATWDGETVKLSCRARAGEEAPSALVSGATDQRTPRARLSEAKRRAQMWEGELPWTDGKRPPLTAHFFRGEAALEVPVLDLRAPDAFAQTPLPEVDAEVAQALRDALLLEAYSGPMVEPEDLPVLVGHELPPAMPLGGEAEDYSVAAFAEARAHFLVVDAWARQLQESRTRGADEWTRVRADGAQLAELFKRKAGKSTDAGTRLPALLVAEEFHWRLEEVEP